ncbi:hypothetical protein [Methylobacterium segetis]|uniref:hypothetical protein n=1 Tax=Methylobacterium segetis TaxID=2488750 RepID=UPI0010493862|nr:hypothetical protein [Methylobacterium segetis]
MNDPQLTASIEFSSNDGSTKRAARLNAVAIYILACERGGQAGLKLITPIIAMNDHKGHLAITWINQAAEVQLSAVAHEAWELVGNEPGSNVSHEVRTVGVRAPFMSK